jgi:hypothetical protein
MNQINSIHRYSKASKLLAGGSIWKVTLSSGKVIEEDQPSFDLLRGHRNIDWYLDIASTGDCARIKELTICTLAGEYTLAISEPYSAFQFKQGMLSIMTGERQANAHIIGRVDNKETGDCTCIVWSSVDQMLHTNHRTNIHYFTSWRRGTPDIGAINWSAMGVRL